MLSIRINSIVIIIYHMIYKTFTKFRMKMTMFSILCNNTNAILQAFTVLHRINDNNSR